MCLNERFRETFRKESVNDKFNVWNIYLSVITSPQPPHSRCTAPLLLGSLFVPSIVALRLSLFDYYSGILQHERNNLDWSPRQFQTNKLCNERMIIPCPMVIDRLISVRVNTRLAKVWDTKDRTSDRVRLIRDKFARHMAVEEKLGLVYEQLELQVENLTARLVPSVSIVGAGAPVFLHPHPPPASFSRDAVRV